MPRCSCKLGDIIPSVCPSLVHPSSVMWPGNLARRHSNQSLKPSNLALLNTEEKRLWSEPLSDDRAQISYGGNSFQLLLSLIWFFRLWLPTVCDCRWGSENRPVHQESVWHSAELLLYHNIFMQSLHLLLTLHWSICRSLVPSFSHLGNKTPQYLNSSIWSRISLLNAIHLFPHKTGTLDDSRS